MAGPALPRGTVALLKMVADVFALDAITADRAYVVDMRGGVGAENVVIGVLFVVCS